MLVEFTHPKEFCQELEREKAHLLGPAVRLTTETRASAVTPNIQKVAVLASFATPMDGGRICVTRLYRHVGEVWGLGQDEQVWKAVEDLHQEISSLCQRLGLEVRAGNIKDSALEVARAH